MHGKKIKFWKVENLNNKNLIEKFPELAEYEYKMRDIEPGTVLFSDAKDGLFIKANEGIIRVLEMQAENAKRMSTSDFLRGNSIEVGKIFE